MIKDFIRKYRTWKFARSKTSEILRKGTLLNAFYTTKTIFIHIPKTAGVSLLKAIYGDVPLTAHRSFYFNRIALNIKNEEYFSFAFVRNPFDRLYSSYMFLKKGGMNHHDSLAFETHLSKFKDFEDFVLNGLDMNLIFKITHLIPQYKYLCDSSGVVLVNFIGKFENFEDDIDLLSLKLKKDIKLSHHNCNKKKDYRDVYNDDMISVVAKIYQKDLTIFKYKFNKC